MEVTGPQWDPCASITEINQNTAWLLGKSGHTAVLSILAAGVDLCMCVGRGGSRICGKEGGGGAAAVPFEDPLWNFKRGGRRGRAPSLALLEDPLWNFKGGGARPLRPPPP